MSSLDMEELYVLAEHGNLDLLRSKLQSSSTDQPQRRLMTAKAARNGHLDVVRYLIESGTEICSSVVINAMKRDNEDNTDTFIRYLVRAGMDINMFLDRMGSPLMFAMALGRPDEYISYILDQGANPDEYLLNGYWTSLELVVKTNPGLIPMFLAHGAQSQGTRALAIAASEGRLDAVRMLLPYFNINEIIEDWKYLGRDDNPTIGTVLHGAVANGHKEVAQVFLDAGIDSSIRDSLGETALEIAHNKGFEELVDILNVN